jgi:hypothetical protein
MCRWSSIRTFQPSQSSRRYSLPELADRSSDLLIATEPSPQCQSVRHRMVDRAVQHGRHNSIVLMEERFKLSYKEVQS